ncbi:hypothetical protein PF003_g19903 [Phytophthora fragariae]|nr:hypothetical protein PF003_g19903 [Phytophthora fragariae]
MEELDEGGSRQAELRLESHEVKRLIHEALSEKSFPPVVQYPEAARGDALLSSLFQWPVIVWVPECVNPTKKPYCIMPERSCTPRVKEYKQRTVEDVDSKCHLLYIKYQCASDSKSCFSTVTAGYIQREARLLMHFPFVMTKKFGISKSLMEMVHEGMTSPHGLSRTVENLQRRREKRYYKLLCLFADRVAQLQLSNPLYLAPTPPSVGQYCSTQKSVGAETLSAAWMQSTSIYSALCEQIMSSIEVKKQMFDGTSIDTQALEGSLQRAHQHSATIRELLAKQIAFTESGRLPRAAFFNSLCLHELDYEAAAGFSGEKHALLRQVVTEQKAATQSWSDCSMVTTIMYNIVVSSNSNHRLNLKRRSFAALSPKIDGLATKKTPSSSDRKIFRIARATPCDENTPREKELQEQLFTALRKMAGIRKKRQIFAKVYDFACCVCAGIHPKAQSFLLSRWDNLKQKENYGANLKIKLKLTPRSWLPYAQQPIIKPHPN